MKKSEMLYFCFKAVTTTRIWIALSLNLQNLDENVGRAGKATPETWASFPSKLVFHFFDSFILTGWRRDLHYDDLYGLTKDNRYED